MTTVEAPTGAALNTTWKTAPTQTITAGGVEFAYRQLGPSTPRRPLTTWHEAQPDDSYMRAPRVASPARATARVRPSDRTYAAVCHAMLSVREMAKEGISVPGMPLRTISSSVESLVA